MKRLLLIAVLVLSFAMSVKAQSPYDPPSLDRVMAVRAKLIDRYVKDKHYAWGVSAMGETDLMGAESNWVTIYVYRDSTQEFAQDLLVFSHYKGEGPVQIDGVTIHMEEVKRRTNERNVGQQQTQHP